jgi:TonB family protein
MTRITGPGRVDPEFFQCLADAEMPKGTLGASVVLHSVLLVFLILLPLTAPQVVTVDYRTITLAPPPDATVHTEVAPLKLPPRTEPVKPQLQQPQVGVERVPEPKAPDIKAPAPEEVRLPATVPTPDPAMAVSVPTPPADPTPAPNLPAPQPPVVTNVFSSAAATAPNSSARRLESAGFGDVGAAERGGTGKTQNAARVGGFDTGAAGARESNGKRAVVMDSGFGASPKPPAGNSQKPVVQVSVEKPVDITFKPRPDYTDQARKLRLEGEVLLRVLFTSTGEVRVLEVLQGLGHGLNESAVRAAERIRFKPAQRESQPIDSTAIVHIVFQLAY